MGWQRFRRISSGRSPEKYRNYNLGVGNSNIVGSFLRLGPGKKWPPPLSGDKKPLGGYLSRFVNFHLQKWV